MISPDDFRRLALSMPEAIESAHMGTVDFRCGRIFATLGNPDAGWAMVKLTPDQQEMRAAAEPEIFVPVPGGWGRGGATRLRLDACDEATARGAVLDAWRNVAPKRLLGA
ncbi:MmcQ/YjbR family DNA-binding protein [Caulobacter sp.]|uniref:MmcQ/YjbR family DNA-binding protein n=1 Tax=Caulobacter sp. TaxID=78 RepID=UPI002B49ABAC|nr:MmcQ/YjbR family DNA-binding protein [Caulobacter sp.]HJV40162.1 MmcQ/YjbR family DNA-binding protein [Caulobacter sp.]